MLEVYVEFGISRFNCKAEQVSELLQLTPTQSWNIGDQSRYGISGLYEFNSWFYVVPVPRTSNVAVHLDALESTLRPIATKIPTIEGYAGVSICPRPIEDDDPQLSMHVSHSLLELIITMDAWLEID